MSVTLQERDNDRSLSTNQNPHSHKVINFKSDKDIDLDMDTEDPLMLLELANLKLLMHQKINFIPEKKSGCNQMDADLKKAEEAGLLITVDSTTGVSTDSSQSAVQKAKKQIQPLFDPSHLKMDWTGSRRVGSGLYNNGNTCFMNSVLQCLTYTPPLANYMFSKTHQSSCKINGFCAMCQFQKHYAQTQQLYQPSTNHIRPVAIFHYLIKIAPTFHIGRQEDSHEFLRYLIDAMQNSCLGNYSNKIPLEQKCTTVIHQIFGGQIRSQVTCFTCKTKSDTFEPMLDLSLNIKGCSTLSDALRRATQPDRLEGNNSYFCEQCKKKVTAEKILSIHGPPRVLTIHLKRFSFGSQLGIKLQTKIFYPAELDIRNYMTEKGPPVFYKLYAVLVHSGYTCNSGHYYCYVVAPNGTWHKMNDTYIAPVGQQNVLGSEAYMLFYKMFTPTKPKTTTLAIQGLAPTQPSPLSTNTHNKQLNTSTNTLPANYKTPPRPPMSPRTPATKSKPSFWDSLLESTPNTNVTKTGVKRQKNPSETSPVSLNGVQSPTEATNQNEDKENSILPETTQKNDTINIYLANTSKPVAVVTPEQTERPRSSISSTSVHKSTPFRSPTSHKKAINFYPKHKPTSTEDVAEKVKMAQAGKRAQLPSESPVESTSVKIPKLDPDSSPAKPPTPVWLPQNGTEEDKTGNETKPKHSKTSKIRTKEKTDKMKQKTLRRLNHADEEEREECILKALKRELFGSREELEAELAEYRKEKKASRSKKVKKKIVSDVEDERITDNNQPKKNISELKDRSFKQFGGKLKSWDQESHSTLSYMNCDEKKEFSDSEFDLEPGKIPKKRKTKKPSKKSKNRFQQEYDRTANHRQ